MNESQTSMLQRRHLRFGWWSLLVFLSLGVLLETFHGFKLDLYLNVANETRRLMWTLGHAHGGLLALVHLAMAASLGSGQLHLSGRRRLASPLLMAASVLMPGGFLLGGAVIYGGDPGIGILLVPIGALCLGLAVLLVAISVGGAPDAGS